MFGGITFGSPAGPYPSNEGTKILHTEPSGISWIASFNPGIRLPVSVVIAFFFLNVSSKAVPSGNTPMAFTTTVSLAEGLTPVPILRTM
jgi:hypothetical protein